MQRVARFLIIVFVLLAVALTSISLRTAAQTHEAVTLKWISYSQERLDFYKQAITEF